MANSKSNFEVFGRIIDTSGRHAAGLRVQALDRDLRSVEILGSATTDKLGRYRIAYSVAQFRRAEKACADLRVRVLAADGKTKIAVSDTVFNAPARAEIDLTVPADKLYADSEWEHHGRELAPLLGFAGVPAGASSAGARKPLPPAELTDEDLDFLHRETGIAHDHLLFIRLASRWWVAQRKHKLPAEAFYGLLRLGVPADWALLLQTSSARRRAALKQAVAQRIVPASLGAQIDTITGKLDALAIEQSFTSGDTHSSGLARPWGLLLASTGIEDKLQRHITGLLLESKPDEDPDLMWKALSDAGIPADAVRSTRFALEADTMVDGHLPTLQALQGGLAANFGDAADLAKLTRQQWLQVADTAARQGGLPKDVESAQAHADALADQVALAFPTAAVMHRLLEDKQPIRRDVGLFLAANPQFDLLNSSVEEALSQANLANIKTPKKQLTQQLHKEVALARITPQTRRAETMTLLQQKGLDSAVKIAMTGEVAFMREVTPLVGSASASMIFKQAKARADTVGLQAITLGNYLRPFSPMLPWFEPEPGGELATWADLFGVGNACECPPCESAHGPGAYLVAQLEFLKRIDAKAPAGGSSLADELQARRPDLWHLKLDCANAETPLPYIDLVIEHLEHLVATLPAARLNYGAATTPQTDAAFSAEQLRAEPDARNTLAGIYAASGPLQSGTYPWQLPFDRGFERTRIDLDLLGTPAAEVLSVLGGSEDALARAHLGLNAATWDLLHLTRSDNATAVLAHWGATDWTQDLVRVGGARGLLKRSGMEAGKLYALLQSAPFAAWHLAIDTGSEPCDVDGHRVSQRSGTEGALLALDEATRVEVFDLLHRALRLRQRMGWTTETLLGVLQALGVTQGSERSRLDLVAVGRLLALTTRLGLTPLALAQRMVALDLTNTAPDTAEAGAARRQWLTQLALSQDQHSTLVALGVPDSLGAPTASTRLEALQAMLEVSTLLTQLDIEPAELRYLLQGVDLVPAVFALADEEAQRQLGSILSAIAAAFDGDPSPEALQSRQRTAAVQRLGEITGTPLVSALVAGREGAPALLRAQGGPAGQALVQDFIALAEADASMPASDRAALESHARSGLLRTHRACRLLGLLHFTAADLDAYAQLHRAPAGDWLDFNTLPVAAGEPPLRFEAVKALLTASAVQAGVGASSPRLLELMATATADTASALETLTAWGRPIAQRPEGGATLLDAGAAALNALAIALGLTPGDANTWRKPLTYARLQSAATWLQGRQLLARDAEALKTAAQGAATAGGLEAATRRRFASESGRRKALTPAMDRLRARQRDALLAHLLHHNTRGWEKPDHVYEHALIDVQMGPCQLTSRIVQAHSAVQMFVQRCLQNLETPQVLLGDTSNVAQWREWAWLKNFRVWEAARKVFLYPENWIEPDLRPGKSLFFETLESELLQNEINADNVERALRNYLEQLHAVSSLDIRALYEEVYEEPLVDGSKAQRRTIHMVGRSKAKPHVYWYRQRDDDLNWTPWEKIELSIDADHLVLAVHNRRPMLFWPQWKEVQINRNDPPATAWEMKLNVSTREFSRWTAPTGSDASLQLSASARETLALRPRIAQGGLEVWLYQGFAQNNTGTPTTSFGFQFALGAFSIDACSGEIRYQAQAGRIPRFLPYRVAPARQSLAENNRAGGSATYLLSGLASDDEPRVEVDPALLARVDEVLTRPGGVCLFLFGGIFVLAADALGRLRALASSARSMSLLRQATEGFQLLPSQQYAQFNDQQPYVLQHNDRQLLALRKTTAVSRRLPGGYWLFMPSAYILEAGEHPYACDLLEALRAQGLDGLYRQAERWTPSGVVPLHERQHPRQLTERSWVEASLSPNPVMVAQPYPTDSFDFDRIGAFGVYNWELFFHIPLLLADQLRQNQRFEDAQRWFHTIFDPTDVSAHTGPRKYWRVKPLFRDADRWASPAGTLEAMMRALWSGSADLAAQVRQWKRDPFNPHALASLRLVAYMKTVVQKYVENLIDWADSLFRRDTMESINEATQLYVLASHILGESPVTLAAPQRMARSYAELGASARIDEFANAMLPFESGTPLDTEGSVGDSSAPGVSMLYFCIPGNPRLRELRATIQDRLFKIRHCQDIDGRLRQLALFAPPIDPALLVRARAAGLDIGTALAMALDQRTPHYRFQPMLQKALEFCNEVRSFGNALLSALEKRDGEQMAQLRARHEVGILKSVALVRNQQIEEAEASLEAAHRSRAPAEQRLNYYSSREFMSTWEQSQIGNLTTAHVLETVGQSLTLASSVAYGFPDATVSVPGGITYGGTHIGNALRAAGGVVSIVASQATFMASLSSIMAGHERRSEDWQLQAELARRELAQIDKQIVAAEIRLAITNQEQRNHEQQIEQSEQAEAMLRDKFTNLQLYNWMLAQLSALHYQSFRMAFDLARQAELAADYELETGLDHIALDSWDTGRKGLLAGERLAQNLRGLEVAYLQANRRRFELTKHVSLRRLDAVALLNLRLGGQCAFGISPDVFAMDFPGHGSRRIKSVSISVPGVVGPYAGVQGTLRLTSAADTPSVAIATSSGQNDAGVFQLDFRDDRYLPFEGVRLDEGRTSWQFTLPAVPSFDYNTIGDLVLHIQYTALELASPPDGRAQWREPETGTGTGGTRRYQLLDLRSDFPDAWRRLHEGAETQSVALRDELFPYQAPLRRLSGLMLLRPGATAKVALGADMAFTLRREDVQGVGGGYLVIEYQLT